MQVIQPDPGVKPYRYWVRVLCRIKRIYSLWNTDLGGICPAPHSFFWKSGGFLRTSLWMGRILTIPLITELVCQYRLNRQWECYPLISLVFQVRKITGIFFFGNILAVNASKQILFLQLIPEVLHRCYLSDQMPGQLWPESASIVPFIIVTENIPKVGKLFE